MSWAAARVTTRQEDIAYSLLGVFGVNMPLLYGEGERAFLRLQAEIIRALHNQSIFAWDEEVEGARTLLAPHSRSFARSGNTTLWHGEGEYEPFGMTNRGLSLRLPLVETRDSKGNLQRRAVLGCRNEDNLAGPIGLNSDTMTRFGAYPLARRGPKLSIVPLEQVATAAYKAVSILERHDPSPAFERAKPMLGNCKCWVRFLTDEMGLAMAEAHPRRFWNTQTSVFVPPRGSSITAGVHFLNNKGIDFILAFGYKREGALPDTTRFHEEWLSLHLPVEGQSLERSCISSSIEQRGSTWVEMLVRDVKVEASIRTTSVMDENVFIVSISLSTCVKRAEL